MPMIRKITPRRWRVQMQRLMLNRRQILKGKSAGGPLLLWLAPCRLRRRLLAIFSNGSLEYTTNRHRRQHHRHQTAGVEHDELPIRTIAGIRSSSPVSDRPTFSVL